MTQININGIRTYSADITNIRSVSFYTKNHKVYSAEKVQYMYGIFVSQSVIADTGFISWKEVSWVADKYEGTDVNVYVRVANSSGALSSSQWNGPYLNSSNDISDLKGQYLQFMVVLINKGVTAKDYNNVDIAVTPIFHSIELSYLSASNSAKFYSSTFNLGFVPKHILLTYNGSIPDDAVVRFAVTGFDSIDSDDYQYIDPNKIEELSSLSILSNKIKLMVEMIGNSQVPLILHEIAFMFSGDQQLMLNDWSSSSSSESSFSSSSSYIENWSSSSSSFTSSSSSSSP